MKFIICCLLFTCVQYSIPACVVNFDPQTGTYQVDQSGKVK